MKFTIVSLFPEQVKQYLNFSLIKKAQEKKSIEIQYRNPRDFATDKQQSVDAKPFGGSDGMLMRYEPLAACLSSLKKTKVKILHLSPQGKLWTNEMAKDYGESQVELVLLCSRYSGLDHRLITNFVDEEISIGDYILTGGELAAAVLVDSISRFVPGVLGNELSSSQDSFNHYKALEAPQFTKPRQVENGFGVPEVLLSGNHKKIREWELNLGLLITAQKRPDLLGRFSLEERGQAIRYWGEMPELEKELLDLKICPIGSVNGTKP